jgi:membrane protease YdiL (CAAX protease family)
LKKHYKIPSADWHWGWKAVFLIVGVVLFGILLNAGLTTAVMLELTSNGLAQEQALEEAMAASAGFEAQVVLSVAQMVFMLWLVRWLVRKVERHHFKWSALGLTVEGRWKFILPGAGLALVLSLSTICFGLLIGTLKYEGNGIALFGLAPSVSTTLWGAILALSSGFGEEVVFRGYLQDRIAKRYTPMTAVMIVAVLFALSHPLGKGIDPLLYFAMAVLVGILFGLVFIRTGSLWMGIALHTVWNYMQVAVVAVRNSADERFFGSPLFVFVNVLGTPHMLVELGVILVGVLSVIWLTKPVMIKKTPGYELK